MLHWDRGRRASHFVLPSMEACVWGCKSLGSHSCCVWHRAWFQGANKVGHGAAPLHPPHPGLHSSGSRELSQLSRQVTQPWITAALTVYYFESVPHYIHHGIGRDHDYSCSLFCFCFFFPLLKIDVEIQLNGSLLGLTVEKGLDLSFSQIRENPCCKKNKKRSTELSPASPQQRSRVWTALVLNAGRSGTVSPAIRLVRGWVNSSKLLLAETALNQPALKWKRPLKWCYWQCFNISHIFQERSVYPITADPAFFATYVSKINLFLWTQHSSS